VEVYRIMKEAGAASVREEIMGREQEVVDEKAEISLVEWFLPVYVSLLRRVGLKHAGINKALRCGNRHFTLQVIYQSGINSLEGLREYFSSGVSEIV
jgi:hypothetical protein